MMRTDLITLTEDLIRFPSDKDHPAARQANFDFILDFLQSRLPTALTIDRTEEAGITTLYLYNAAQRAQPEVMLSGHLDVIAASPADFEPHHDAQYLYGRGSGDMKSGLAVLLLLFIKYFSTSNVSLLITSDEELGSQHGAKIVAPRLHPELVLIPEPTNNQIIIKEKGATWCDIYVTGPGGHASRPWKARNAVDILFEITNDLRQHFKTLRTEEWADTLNIGAFYGGNLELQEAHLRPGPGNVIATTATARLDLRLTENLSHQQAYTIIDSVLETYQQQLGAEYTLRREKITHVDHLITDATHPYVQQFHQLHVTHFGPTEPQGEAGASDGRYFSLQNIPVILYGPISLGHHSTNEKVDLASVEKCYQVYDKFLSTWPGRG